MIENKDKGKEIEKVETAIETPAKKELDPKLKDKIVMKDAESQLVLGYRDINTVTFGKIRIKHPTVEIDGQADIVYAVEYNRLLMSVQGLPTSKELSEVLEKRKIWTSEDDSKIEEAGNNYSESLVKYKVELAKDKPNSKLISQIETECDKSRKILLKLEGQKQTLFINTIEQRAEQERIKFKLSKCIFKVNKETNEEIPVWKTVNDLNKEDRADDVRNITFEAILFWKGIGQDFLGELLGISNGDKDGK